MTNLRRKNGAFASNAAKRKRSVAPSRWKRPRESGRVDRSARPPYILLSIVPLLKFLGSDQTPTFALFFQTFFKKTSSRRRRNPRLFPILPSFANHCFFKPTSRAVCAKFAAASPTQNGRSNSKARTPATTPRRVAPLRRATSTRRRKTV